MHFDLSFTLGNVVTISTLMGLGAILLRVDRTLRRFAVEHEMLIADYCKREGIRVRDLPTRSRLDPTSALIQEGLGCEGRLSPRAQIPLHPHNASL